MNYILLLIVVCSGVKNEFNLHNCTIQDCAAFAIRVQSLVTELNCTIDKVTLSKMKKQ